MSSAVNFPFITLNHLLIGSFTNSHQRPIYIYMGGKTLIDYLLLLFSHCVVMYLFGRYLKPLHNQSAQNSISPELHISFRSQLKSNFCPSSEKPSLTAYKKISLLPLQITLYSITLFLFSSQHIPARMIYFIICILHYHNQIIHGIGTCLFSLLCLQCLAHRRCSVNIIE